MVLCAQVTGLRIVEASRNHVELDSYGNEIKEESRVDNLKGATKEERLRRTFDAIDEDESGMSGTALPCLALPCLAVSCLLPCPALRCAVDLQNV
eukprot:COSAG06_NODE_29497_length_555_cov_1.017544_1_plen_94_part_01